MEGRVVDPVESANRLLNAVFGDAEAILLQLRNRAPPLVDDAGEELDVLHVDSLDRVRAVDEDDVLGAAAVGQERRRAEVGQVRTVEHDRLHPWRLVERRDPFFTEKQLEALDLLAVRHGDFDHRLRALQVLLAGPRFDEPGAESLAAAVDRHLVRGDDLAVLDALDANPVLGRVRAQVQFHAERRPPLAQDLPTVEREGDGVEVADRMGGEAHHADTQALVPRRHQAQQALAARRRLIGLGKSREGLQDRLPQRLRLLEVRDVDRLVDHGELLAEDIFDLEPDLDLAGPEVSREDERDGVLLSAARGQFEAVAEGLEQAVVADHLARHLEAVVLAFLEAPAAGARPRHHDQAVSHGACLVAAREVPLEVDVEPGRVHRQVGVEGGERREPLLGRLGRSGHLLDHSAAGEIPLDRLGGPSEPLVPAENGDVRGGQPAARDGATRGAVMPEHVGPVAARGQEDDDEVARRAVAAAVEPDLQLAGPRQAVGGGPAVRKNEAPRRTVQEVEQGAGVLQRAPLGQGGVHPVLPQHLQLVERRSRVGVAGLPEGLDERFAAVVLRQADEELALFVADQRADPLQPADEAGIQRPGSRGVLRGGGRPRLVGLALVDGHTSAGRREEQRRGENGCDPGAGDHRRVHRVLSSDSATNRSPRRFRAPLLGARVF